MFLVYLWLKDIIHSEKQLYYMELTQKIYQNEKFKNVSQ
jgi:hypothetical protein